MEKEYLNVLNKNANDLKNIVGGKWTFKTIRVTNVPLLGMFFEKELIF